MRYRINLLTKQELGFLDKTLYFFLNYLRYILVLTQIVVIGVLFYRFRVDQNIIDLKDSLQQKREIIEAVRPLLQEAEKVNDQTIAIRKIVGEQAIQTSAIQYLLSIFPQTATLEKLSIHDNSFDLEGTTVDSRELQLFYARLKQDKRFNTVNLANIKRGSSGYTFTMTLQNFASRKTI